MVEITGKEANILLYALDHFFGTNERGVVNSRTDSCVLQLPEEHPANKVHVGELQELRDKLFAVHEH